MARNSRKSYEIDMLNGPILPKILRFSVPLTLSTMLQLLFNAADVVVVGRYAGDNSLAAVGSNTALINLLTNKEEKLIQLIKKQTGFIKMKNLIEKWMIEQIKIITEQCNV